VTETQNVKMSVVSLSLAFMAYGTPGAFWELPPSLERARQPRQLVPAGGLSKQSIQMGTPNTYGTHTV